MNLQEKILKWLNVKEIKILKQIIIVSDRQNGETELGSILYTRPMNESYNLKKQQEEDEKSTESSFDRLFKEHPKQENYPNDRLDEIIFESIKKIYPKSVLRNETILFNVDLDKIETLKNRIAIPCSIYFSPEFSNIGNYSAYLGQEFKVPLINLNIYSYYKPEFLINQNFYATYNLTEENILNSLEILNFE